MAKTIEMNAITGQRITKVRKMTTKELEAEGWEDTPNYGIPMVLELEDGQILYPSSDEEGNCAGALFGSYKTKSFYVTPEE